VSKRAGWAFASTLGVGLFLMVAAKDAPAAPSGAEPFTPELTWAYELANEHWGGVPTQCTSIEFAIVPNGSLGDFEGEATLPEPGEAPQPCWLYLIRRDAAPNWFERACAVIRHEDGHLHGLHHSTSPNSIMYPTVPFVPGQCMDAGLFLLNHPNRFGRHR
jgi:hypothetical protein